MSLEGKLKIDKPTSALIAIKAGDGYAKDEVVEVGSKKKLKEIQEELSLEKTTKVETIKAVRN